MIKSKKLVARALYLVFALALVAGLTLVPAVAASPDASYSFETRGDGIAEWSTTQVKPGFGNYSVKITTPAGQMPEPYLHHGVVKVPYGEALNTIDDANLTFCFNTAAASTDLILFGQLYIDSGGGNVVDKILQSDDAEILQTGTGTWKSTHFAAGDSWRVVDYDPATGVMTEITPDTHGTLAVQKAKFPDATLIYAAAGGCGLSALSAIVYIDDICIDGITHYDLEPVAQAPVDLGTAGNFAILAKTGITTTGTTSIVGDIGVSPISYASITGFALTPVTPDGTNTFATSPLVMGKVYAADYTDPTPAYMTTAVSNMETAYTDAAGRTPPNATELYGGNLGGLTIAPGLYKWSSGVTIPTDVTLDAQGDPDAVWIFQIAGTLDISSATSVILSDGAQAKNIFWAVADVVSLGTTSEFNGNILAQTNIAMTNGATLNGRALAQSAVTLIANTITAPGVVPIAMDKDYYSTSGTVNVTVFDDAANTNPVVKNVITVYASSDTDSVVTLGNTLTLTETSYNTGIFKGSFTLIPTPPPAAGQVVVTNGDSIYVKYTAVSNVPYTATAGVDTTVPTIDATLTVSGTGGPWSVPPITIIPCTIPVITATYTDASSGIDTTSVVMKVNGVAVTPDSTTTTTVTYTSPALAAGTPVTVTVDVSDIVGNAAVTKSWSFTIAAAFNVAITAPSPAVMPAGTPTTVTVTYTGVDGLGIDTSSPADGALKGVVTTLSGPGVSETYPETVNGSSTHTFSDVTAEQAGTITVEVVGTFEPVSPSTTDVEVTKTLYIDVTGFLVAESWADVDLGTTGTIAMTVNTKTGAPVNTGKVVITAATATGFQKDVNADSTLESFQIITIDGVAGTITYDGGNAKTYAVANGLYQVTGIKYAGLGAVEVEVYAGTDLQAKFSPAFTVQPTANLTLSFAPTQLTAGVSDVGLAITITNTATGAAVTDISTIKIGAATATFSQASNVYTVTVIDPSIYTTAQTLTVTAQNAGQTNYGTASLTVALPTVAATFTVKDETTPRSVMLTGVTYTVSVTVTDAVGEPLDGYLWIGALDEDEVFAPHAPTTVSTPEDLLADGTGEFDISVVTADIGSLVWMIGSDNTLADPPTQALVLEPAIAVEDLYYDVNPTEATVDVDTTYTVKDNYLDVAGNRDVKIVTPGGDVVNKVTTPVGTFKYTAAEVGGYYVSVKLGVDTWQAPITISATVALVSIAASPSPVNLTAVNETEQLAITATYSDDSTASVTANCTYTSSNETVATVSTGGLITAKAEGSATVTVSYTESGITKTAEVPVTVTVTFTITATAGANGSISPPGAVVVNYGADQEFTITPDIGYEVEDVLVDDASFGAVSSYTFENVTADHAISATFFVPVTKGDFDGDNDIDLVDFVQFATAYGSELGDDNYNAIGDFDDNGEIGLLDFVQFATVYDTSW